MNDIIAKFKSIPSTCVADATNGMSNMDTAIKPLKEEYVVCGRAFTVKMPAGDNMQVLRAIKEAQPGDILIIDSKGYTSRSAAGEFVVGLAKILGLGGMVVDGSIRDIINIKSLNFPVFCKGTTASASIKGGCGQISVAISCGGVNVRPGDVIIGDADGVVVVPQEEEKEVFELAQKKMISDQIRAKKFLASPESARTYLDELFKSAEK